MLTIQALYCYPFKSARGIRLSEARVEARGLAFDRRWMAVDIGGKFLSQRTHPLLGLITTSLTDTSLVLEAPGIDRLSLPLFFESPYRRNVTVWDDTMSALECGDEASDWISTFLHERTMIVYFPDDSLRSVDPRYAAHGEHTAFADAFPVLLITQASLDDLNLRLKAPLPMNRFRPNIVVDGAEPYAEDTWGRIRLGGSVELDVVKPCARCAITTIDQETLERGNEPLATLSAYRQSGSKLLFGQNALVSAPGVLRTGDQVHVSARE
ncbi:MAG: MOSC domain-containing protein [Acidobacteriota bacterium]